MPYNLKITRARLLILSIYIIPVFLSFAYSLFEGYLTGDHWHLRYQDTARLAQGFVVFCLFNALFLLVLCFLSRLDLLKRLSRTIWVQSLPTSACVLILVSLMVLIQSIGLVPVGASSPSRFATLLSSFNPLYGILILVALNTSRITLILSTAASLFASLQSHSLFPLVFIFLIFIYAYKDFMVIRLSARHIVLIIALSVIVVASLGAVFNVLLGLFEFRNSMRGSEASMSTVVQLPQENLFLGMIIGRISSFSAFIFMRDFVENSSFALNNGPSVFYIFERLLGLLQLGLHYDSPLSVGGYYNDMVIGIQRDWGTIMSLPGYFLLTLHLGLAHLMSDLFSVFSLLVLLSILAFPAQSHRLAFVLIASFQYFISGDPLELINTAKSIILWLILIKLFDLVLLRMSSLRN
jgi:hypothetical protein